MKKLFILTVLFSAFFCMAYAKSNKESEPVADISQYYASKDQVCDFILEFENQSEGNLTITNCIFNRKKRKTFTPAAKSEDITLAAGECRKFRIKTADMINDYSSLSVGFYCYEKDWYWWYDINPQMNQNHMKIIVSNDSKKNGGDSIIYPKFKAEEDKNLDDFLVDSSYDFVCEVINSSSGNITVQPVLDRLYSGPNFGDGIFASGNEVIIEKGKSHQFKYRFNRGEGDPLNLNLYWVVFGSYIKLDGASSKGNIGRPFLSEDGKQNNLVDMKLTVEVTDDFMTKKKPFVVEPLPSSDSVEVADYKGKSWTGGYQGRMKEGSVVVKLNTNGSFVFQMYDEGFNTIWTVYKGTYKVEGNTLYLTSKGYPETTGTSSDNWNTIYFSGFINGSQVKTDYIPYE